MVQPEILQRLPFFRGLPPRPLGLIAAHSEVRRYENNALVAVQHDRAIAVYFLLSGTVQFLIRVAGEDDLLVAVGSEPGLIVGWAAFRAPFRYTTSARCEQECHFLRVPHDVFDRILSEDKETGLLLMRRAAEAMAHRLEFERDRLVDGGCGGGLGRSAAIDAVPPEPRRQPEPMEWDLRSPRGVTELLRHTHFFEDMDERFLAWLAHQAHVLKVAAGETLFERGKVAHHLYLVIEGRIGFVADDAHGAQGGMLRTLGGLGEPLGWSALVDPRRYRDTCVALGPARLLAIPNMPLEQLCEDEPDFGIALFRRVLQLIGSRLRAIRVGLVARRYAQEALTIRAMLDQAAESLHVSSALHKIPYLLENRLTLADAFHVLELTRAHGDPLERDLADRGLEILEAVRRELDFYRGLQAVYETVANAPRDLSPEDVRKWCMEVFAHLFRRTSCRIRGEENLPERGGNLVIMNHLENHPDTALPNGFRLTLDSHFVSSMILYQRYGEAPVRVVRKPPVGWFGHQQYFDRLDYIYVYPGDVDEEDRDRRISNDDRIRAFIERAAGHLMAGQNLVIAPEGRCMCTEESPAPFRLGAFRLAASVKPEPLIVPVAVANFDKKITQTTTAAIVYPPFRLSQEVADPQNKEALVDFVTRLRERYRAYVREAVALARG
jgi:CRP-like cAMP-binding protein/1-acyl-sn-glycerol-3-phosphate acyltransferase